jgi:hypothetical protein
MIFTVLIGKDGVNETEHIPLTFWGKGERVHCCGENPAGEGPPGVGLSQETTPVGTMPFEPRAIAWHVVLEPRSTEGGLQETEKKG